MGSEPFTATVEYIAKSTTGILVFNGDGAEVWLNFQHLNTEIQEDAEQEYYSRGDEVTVELPAWLAEEKGIYGDLE